MDDSSLTPPHALALALNRRLIGQDRLKLVTAESCTGGAIATAIVAVAGSSDYFLGGIVAYGNEAKHRLLAVSRDILATRGAVSPECARAMAAGARAAFGADLAVATTGIAGPGGATASKPVGLVYIALATPAGVVAHEHHFPGDRAAVIAAATTAGLELLLVAVESVLGDAC